MPLTAANNTAQLTITSTDANGNTSINRGAGNPTLNGTFSEYVLNQNIAIGTTLLTTGPVFNLYIKNNAAPGSGITLQVLATLSGGASQILALLQPGGICLVWNVVNNVAGSGYTSVSVVAAGGVCPVEYIFGG
jgi:hypothetical protein